MNDDILTILSVLLAVIALALSIWQTKLARLQIIDAKKQAEEAKLQTERITSISNALSTRYLGEFPEYVLEVANVISNATRDLKIVCTIPTHAVYSYPDGWFAVKQKIEKALAPNSKINVSCVFSEPTIQDKFIRTQLKEAALDWQTFRSAPNNIERIRQFFNRFGNSKFIDITSDDFFNLFNIAAEEELKTTYKGADIVHVSYRLPLYIWIADDKEAVFVISSTTPSFLAEAFWTRDSRLINALTRLYAEYRGISAYA